MGSLRFLKGYRKAIYIVGTLSFCSAHQGVGTLLIDDCASVCPESLNAIQGAAATVCEAVDRVITSTRTPASQTPPVQRAFVAIRPPGHHCGEDTPSGFCFVNNVAIGAAHGMRRLLFPAPC